MVDRSSVSAGTATYCAVCGAPGLFGEPDEMSLRAAVADAEKREALPCGECNSISRERGLMATMGCAIGAMGPVERWAPQPELRVLETSGYRGHPSRLAERFDYFNTRLLPQGGLPDVLDGRTTADLTDLSYPDGFMDVVLSAEVLEHVHDHRSALREIFRVLSPEGLLVLQAPYAHVNARTSYRVHRWNGRDVHLYPPEYHAEDTLVFQIFGRDLLTHMREAGFAPAHMRLAAPRLAITPQDVFLATKGPYLDLTPVLALGALGSVNS